MRRLLMASAAAVSLIAVPVVASADEPTPTESVDSVPGSINAVKDKRGGFEMTEEQEATYAAWPAEWRTDYDVWPYEYQVYYWGLTPEYQTGYWALTPEQRAQIMAMTAEQQAEAWNGVLAQLAEKQKAQTVYTSNATVQGNMTATAKSDYPVCGGTVQDSCINPWAAGKRGPGVNKPLGYWPGKPASELGG